MQISKDSKEKNFPEQIKADGSFSNRGNRGNVRIFKGEK